MQRKLTITLTLAVMFIIVGSAQASLVGLVAYYDFEGTGGDQLLDKAGVHNYHLNNNDNNVTFVAATSGAAGSTQVASFDGQGETNALYTPGHNAGVLGNVNMTISFWMMGDRDSQAGSQRRLMSTNQAAPGETLGSNWVIDGFGKPNPGAPAGESPIFNASGASNVTFHTMASPPTWHHVAIVAKGGDELQVWVDGVMVDDTNWAPGENAISVGGRLVLGAERANGHRGYTGLLDDVAFFNRALTQAEIEGIAAGTIAIPEPASLALVGIGGLLMLCRRRAA